MIINFKQFNENILVPRNLEGRKEKLKQMNIKLLSQEVIDENLILDESFMDIDAKFVKLKKVNGFIWLNGGQWTEIPKWLKDVKIGGRFICQFNELTTLYNCPKEIGGNLECYNNKVKLELPDYVKLKGELKNIDAFSNGVHKITYLEGAPKNISSTL